MSASRSMRATRVTMSAALVLSIAAGWTLTGRSTLITRILEGSLNGHGEYVLGNGYRAAELFGLPIDDYFDLTWEKIPLSYETGSNASGWGG